MNRKILVPPLVLHLLYVFEVFGAPFTPWYGDATGVTSQNSLSFCGYKSKKNSDLKSFKLLPDKHSQRHLTYAISVYTNQLAPSTVNNEIAKAFQEWSDVTDLTFTRRDGGSVDIDVRFVVGSHGDNDPFDGLGNVLAHANLIQIHFDDSENWSTESYNGVTNLYSVAAHEIGHALGLDHSDIQGTMMYPSYDHINVILQLHYDDIQGIQSLYGAKTTIPAGPVYGYPSPQIPNIPSPQIPNIPSPQIPNGFSSEDCTSEWDGFFLRTNCKKSSSDSSYYDSSLGSPSSQIIPFRNSGFTLPSGFNEDDCVVTQVGNYKSFKCNSPVRYYSYKK